MDSLLSKIGLIPVKKGLSSEGSDPSQMQQRSVQVCVCRSPSAPSKPSSAIATNAPVVQETSTDSAFNSLPLPSSRTSVPPPLRFLWFNWRNSPTNIEDRDSEQGYSINSDNVETACIPQGAENDEDRTSSLLLSAQNFGDSMSLPVDPKLRMQKQVDTFGKGLLDECGNMVSVHETHLDSLEQTNLAVNMLSNAIIANADPPTKRSWISKITDFKSLWPVRKEHAASPDISKIGSSSSKDKPSSVSKHEGSCDGCELSDCHGCSLEVPYIKLNHSKETFSKYLQDTSLFTMKVLAQMSTLCDMAYTIPDIKPGQLLKHHRLKFVTSSLEKKSEVEAKLKEHELQKGALKNHKHGASDERPKSEEKTTGSDFATCNPEGKLFTLPTVDDSELNIKWSGDRGDGHAASKGHVFCTPSQAKLEQVEHTVDTVKSQESLETTDDEVLITVAPVSAMLIAEEKADLAITKEPEMASSCPCEWFICDDESSHTRFFAIQGSESMAAWQTNLFFEPTKFEGLDVLVHRGIYEAANALYEQVLPEVLAHFLAHGEHARIRLTGHSLGGGLATLLALMFQIRGILPRKCILPVVTFGSPCIMCGGDNLLRKMDLPQNHIQSIIMHRDIVPRAFSCDYPDHVAEILKRLNKKFRDHPCLNIQKLLYAPMGQLLILQPDETTAPSHPLLPCGYGLYLLRHPSNGGGIKSAIELRAAQRAFLNLPHPLEILSNPGAYGLNGAVSRDHNPRSYAKAIHVVLKHEAKRLRQIQKEQRRQLWWPLVIAETSWFAQRGQNSSSVVDYNNISGACTPAICKTSSLSSHTMNRSKYNTFNRIAFSLGSSSLWRSQKVTVSRYVRLIASKHVQIGMLLVVSIRVVIIECLHTIHVLI